MFSVLPAPQEGKFGGMEVSDARRLKTLGYRRLHILLGREGVHMNHKRLRRLYREERLKETIDRF